jgi:hypothetical protein
MFSDQTFISTSHLSHACYMTWPSHPNVITQTPGEDYKLWTSLLHNLFWSLVTPPSQVQTFS